MVKAIYIRNSDSITAADLNVAKGLINTFVEDYQRLYGLKNMVFNVHLLIHLVTTVRNWGPMWVFSALPFESLNKRIVDSITSPYHRADQVVMRLFMKKFVIVASKRIRIAEKTRSQINSILKIQDVQVEGMPEGHYIVGRGKSEARLPNDQEVELVRASGKIINPATHVIVYKNAIINGTKYKARDNKRRMYCNHIAFCRPITFIFIEKFILYRYRG